MTSEMTADEVFDSLNGFDEIAITQRFGASIGALAKNGEAGIFMFLRALAFIAERRAGKGDNDAYMAAMNLSTKEANAYFADPADELDPADPETESGKDD